MSSHRGFFITLEGPEGSGKSSQARALVAHLRRRGHHVLFVRDPGSTALGRRLRQVLLHQDRARISPMAEAMLFIAGRVQLVTEQIQPALAKGWIVVCDRFHDSTIVYQGDAGQLDVAWLDQLGREAIGRCLPQLTLLLDVPPDIGFARLRRKKDRMERKAAAFHRRVRAGYLRLARKEPRRVAIINAARSAALIRQEIREIAETRLSPGSARD